MLIVKYNVSRYRLCIFQNIQDQQRDFLSFLIQSHRNLQFYQLTGRLLFSAVLPFNQIKTVL